MNILDTVLVLGSGGREHAIVMALNRSSGVSRIFVAPGNGGTATMGARVQNVPIVADDIDALVKFCSEKGVTCVVPGPEAPLVKGIADRLSEAGIPCFGPCACGAALE